MLIQAKHFLTFAMSAIYGDQANSFSEWVDGTRKLYYIYYKKFNNLFVRYFPNTLLTLA